MSHLQYQFGPCSQSKCHRLINYSVFKAKNILYYKTLIQGFLFTSNPLVYKPNAFTFVKLKKSNQRLDLTTRCKNQYPSANCNNLDDDNCVFQKNQKQQAFQKGASEKSFWGAVGLIIGTAVGPGMLGLPAATIKSGPIPSTICIILSWVYVMSSIILVAELSFAAMEEDNVAEVSFTGLATRALGNYVGSFVALVYASLSFSLLVACVSGIGSIISQWFPWINIIAVNAFFPVVIGILLWLFPFSVIDAANRFLCLLMLCSITALVSIGLFVGRTNIFSSFARASWGLSSVLPAIPVTVLTLGFHVITPFICKIAGNNVNDARKAVLIGGIIPLLMVLSWNLIVLGLAGTGAALSSSDPISLVLSVNSFALPAVQGFAFSALATSLIGYAVSFPKQVVDTLELILGQSYAEQKDCHRSQTHSVEGRVGKVGCVTYSSGCDHGRVGHTAYGGTNFVPACDVESACGFMSLTNAVTPFVLGISVLLASFFHSTFSRALDYAGIYANCFLFGICPPVMAYVIFSRKKVRSTMLPGGDVALLLLFAIAVVLGIWH